MIPNRADGPTGFAGAVFLLRLAPPKDACPPFGFSGMSLVSNEA